jgi:hypothetical protein
MVCASGDAEAHRQLYVAAPRKVRRGWIKVHPDVAARSTQRTGAQRMSYTLAAASFARGPDDAPRMEIVSKDERLEYRRWPGDDQAKDLRSVNEKAQPNLTLVRSIPADHRRGLCISS